MESKCQKIQDIIGSDIGDRGMKSLIVPGDLLAASEIFSGLDPSSTVLVVSGFPCCVDHCPPTETDGPPGTLAIARAAIAFGHNVYVVTDECNKAVFEAAIGAAMKGDGWIQLETFPPEFSEDDEERFGILAQTCNLLIACERAGPGKDGICYTMRGIDMNARGLIAPIHRFREECKVPFLAIGDGGNELGMGKVLDKIICNPMISNGEKIGCVVAADHLIAASVSNWGGYALAAGAALARAEKEASTEKEANSLPDLVSFWVERCLPTEDDEIELLNRCVEAGCRDGISGKLEATVDGMPLQTSLQCLRDIRDAALGP